MNSIYHFKQEQNIITYFPYADNRKVQWPMYLGLAMLIAFAVIYFGEIAADEWITLGLPIIGTVLFVRGIYECILKSNIKLTFDKNEGVITRRSILGATSKQMHFDEAGEILVESSDNHICYCLATKNDRFGKNLKISNWFNKDKNSNDWQEFEQLILPAVRSLLEIN